ncbi:MAG: hypothetical protein GWO08_16105, partial [Gammaproteobacteria bacterium]|nr:hypothetical protein [Gammaproteobacteria bacterium]NIR95121.1 hypothetical protein [Gammaproteobacteria bacterium]NIW47098.1 hypothetical protein [Gammaproteobacteria bacterium]NIX55902.1 hypothetical protein [candidate division Zixibacteria bacterium]
MRIVTGVILSILISLAGCSGSGAGDPDDTVLDESYYTDIHGWNDDKGLDSSFLGRGINLGNYLEAPRDSDGDGVKEDNDGEGNWTG